MPLVFGLITSVGHTAASKEKDAETAAQLTAVTTNALDLVSVGRIEQAEKLLLDSTVRAPKGSCYWHTQAAHRLFEMGLYFQAQANGELSANLAARALREADQAIVLSRASRDVGAEAQAWKIKATITDTLLQDIPAALSFYKESVRLKPDSESLRGLKRAEAIAVELKRNGR